MLQNFTNSLKTKSLFLKISLSKNRMVALVSGQLLPRKIASRLRLRLGLGLELGLGDGAIFLRKNCPRTGGTDILFVKTSSESSKELICEGSSIILLIEFLKFSIQLNCSVIENQTKVACP